MTIGRGRSDRKRATLSRLSLAGTVVAFACSSNDIGPLTPSAPPPFIDGIFPSAAVVGSADLTLTISGNNFVEGGQGSHAAWAVGGDTTLLSTTYVGSTRLTATIPAALLRNSVTAHVLLETGDVMGDVPLFSSNAVGFPVTDGTNPSMTGGIIVYGRTTTLPPKVKGSREASLDGSPWVRLIEGQSLTYSPVAPGDHRLALSEPCSATGAPSIMKLTVSGGQTVTIGVAIPPSCE